MKTRKSFSKGLSKAEVLARLEEHKRLDQIVQGIGFDDVRGCSVGCILNKYDHEAFETELGLPEWFARLIDVIHEGLPNGEHVDFPIQVIKATPEGVDIEKVKHVLAIKRLTPLAEKNKIVSGAIMDVVDLHQKALDGVEVSCFMWAKARDSAKDAVWDVDSAERSAERFAVWSAVWSAEESAEESAALSAALSAVWQQERDNLLDALYSLKGE